MIHGTVVYQSSVSAVQTGVVLVVAYAIGARFGSAVTGVVLTMAAAMPLTIVFAALSNAVALLVRQQEALIGISQLLSLPLTFLSSAIMATALMPAWIQNVARYNPLDWAVLVSREALSAAPGVGVVTSRSAALLVLAVLMSWLATRAFTAYQKSV